tara:strand:+ start:2263 stop:2598 length:336 start_codon:yes stop_codon:yes gene_type:complete
MDPITVTGSHWAEISQFLNFMFYSVGVVIIIATNLLVGYIFIPSLVDSEDSPLSVINGAKLENPKFVSFLLKIQKTCYAICIISSFALIYLLYTAFSALPVVKEIYNAIWI